MTKTRGHASATGQNAVMRIEAEAAVYGVLRTTDSTGRHRFDATCAECGRRGGMFNASIVDADQVIAHLRKQGWVLTARESPLCSTQCARQARAAKKVSVIALTASEPARKGKDEFTLIQSAFERAKAEKRAGKLSGPFYTVIDPGLTPLKGGQVLAEDEFRRAIAEHGFESFTAFTTLDESDGRVRFVLAWSQPLAKKVREGLMTLEDAYRRAKEERSRVDMTSIPKPPKPSAPPPERLWGPKPAAEPNTPASPPPAIPPNPKITRRVVTLLNDNFDADRRLYHPGWSDERVAKEGDTSLEFVISYRRQAYAELAEDPEATKIRSALAVLEDKLIQQSIEIDDLRVALDRYVAGAPYNKAQG